MMLLALLFSCLFAGSLACSDDQCKDPKLANELMDVQFLPSEEELKYLCPKVLTFLECEKEFFECPGKTLIELSESSDDMESKRGNAMLGGMSLVRDLCDETSSIHLDYIASVDCFRNYIATSGHACRLENEGPIEEFFSQIYPEGDVSDEAYAEIRCLTDALETACIVDNLGDSCGSAAQELAMEALRRMKGLLKAGACQNVENAADLKTRMLDFLELKDEKREKIQSVIDLFKRRR